MPKISPAVEKIVNKIIELSDGSIDEQIHACKELLCKKIFPKGCLKDGIDASVISKLLPSIVRFMNSENDVLQQEGAFFIAAITCTPNMKANTKLVIEANAILSLINLLSTSNSMVLDQSLDCLCKIAAYYPRNVIENDDLFSSLNDCLQSVDQQILYQAAKLLNILSTNYREGISAILEGECVEPLVNLMESKNDDIIIEALSCLSNFVDYDSDACQCVIDNDALQPMKRLFDRLFIDAKKSKGKKLCKPSEEIISKLMSLIEKIISYHDEAQIDLIIDENIIPSILQHIYGAVTTHEIKIQSIKILQNLITIKRDIIPTLISDYDIIALLYNNLQAINADLLIAVLSAIKFIIENFDDEEISRQKIVECRNPWKLNNLCGHFNESVKNLSKWIYDFVNNQTARSEDDEQEFLCELDSDEDTPAPQAHQRRKRVPQTFERVLTRSKRTRILVEQNNNEHSASPVNGDDDEDIFHDFDDNHSGNYSPVNLNDNTVANSNETIRNEIKPRIAAASASPIVIDLPIELPTAYNSSQNNLPNHYASVQSIAAPAAVDEGTAQNETIFEPIKYWRPPESYICKYCEQLGLKYIEEYERFIPEIKIRQITANLKPDKCLTPKDKNGFSCFSILFTGNENSADEIMNKINGKFVDDMEIFDKKKIKEVGFSSIILPEHLQTIARWLKCKIMIYCDERWERIGDWSCDDQNIPIFVLKKNNTDYQIVLSLNN